MELCYIYATESELQHAFGARLYNGIATVRTPVYITAEAGIEYKMSWQGVVASRWRGPMPIVVELSPACRFEGRDRTIQWQCCGPYITDTVIDYLTGRLAQIRGQLK